MTPDQYCHQKAAARGSSLHYSFLFLPPARRRAAAALHAFHHEIANVVDESPDPQLARTKLAWWRVETGKLFAGSPQHPVTKALQPHLADFRITAESLNAIIDGLETDLVQTRYLDFAGLEHYCRQGSGTVSVLAAGIFGYRNPVTLEYARQLGTALQLTGVILDVGKDARQNRIYLPMDELKKFEVPASDILQARYSDNFRKLMAYQARRAEAFYDTARQALPPEDVRAQRAGLILAAICRATLAEVERDGFPVLTHRTSLTPLRKFWLAWKTWVST